MASEASGETGPVRLADLARVIRSKNAKPFYITFDVLFDDKARFDRVVSSNAFNAEEIARLYQVEAETVKVVVYPAALAIKATVERWIPAAAFGDRDLLGAQQAVPLYDIQIP